MLNFNTRFTGVSILLALLVSGPANAQETTSGQPFAALQAQIDQLRADLMEANNQISALQIALAAVQSNTVLQLSGLVIWTGQSTF